MVSSSFPILSLVSKDYHFEHFPLKSPVIIEIAGLRLLMLFTKGLKLFTILAKRPIQAREETSFIFMVISVTKNSFRLDISSLQIMRKCSL